MQNELHLGSRDWGWVTGVFSIAYAIFEVPGGFLGDRFGARLMLTRIVLWWSAFTSLTGMVSSFFALLLVRFCFGAGEAGAYPNASSSIFNWFPPAERGRAFGLIWMSSQFGGAVAPLLVIPIQVKYGWRTSFHILGVLGAVWAVTWWAWYRNRPEKKSGISGEELAEIGFTSEVRRHSFPGKAILSNASVWALMGTPLSWVYAYHFFQSWFHTYLVRARGFTENHATALCFAVLAGRGK
jgi:MFS family permease